VIKSWPADPIPPSLSTSLREIYNGKVGVIGRK
jgi:hypothetical protein